MQIYNLITRVMGLGVSSTSLGRKERRTGAGAGGRIEYDAMVLPKIGFRAGGFDSVLQPAEINLNQDMGFGYHGIIGLNLLNQAQVVTLDFRTMSLTLRNRRQDASSN